jgi:uncharacterized repeat protein (TIGR02543 family)
VNYTLTVNESGQGTVTSTDGKINCANGGGTCSASYASGSSVTLNANAASGWTFQGWSGACNGSNPCTVAMNSNLSATATFTQNAVNYTLTVNESGQGTVTSTDGKINCTNGAGTCSATYAGGTPVTLNETPASNWTFSGWSGTCSGNNPSCSVVVNASVTATATFQNTPLSVSCSIAPNQIVLGQGATVTAYGFGGDRPYSFTINGSPGSSIIVLPTAQGTYTASATVTDSQNHSASTSCTATVVIPTPALSSLQPDRTPHAGQPFNLTIYGSGFATGIVVDLCDTTCYPNPIVNIISDKQLYLPNVQWNSAETVNVKAINVGNLISNSLQLVINP